MHFIYSKLRFGHNLAHRHSVYHGRHGDYSFAVFTLDGRRRESLHNFAKFFDSDSSARRCVDNDVLDVGERCSVLFVIHHFYVIFLAVFTES